MTSVPPNFLIRFANKRSTFHNYLFLILTNFSFVYLFNFVSYLLFYIRHIAMVYFYLFFNKSSMSTLYFVVALN